MMKVFGILVFSIVLLKAVVGYSHGDHSAPGALPTAPNGGKLVEAKAEKDTPAGEFFFDTIVDKKINLYPLLLEPNAKKFKSLNPKDIKIIEAKAQNPRTKKFDIITLKPFDKNFEIDMPFKDSNRMILFVTVLHDGTNKIAEIQVEKKR